MRIAVDLDDVVMDFWAGLCNSLNTEYGLSLDPTLTTDWEHNEVKHLGIFGEGRTWWDWLRDRDWIWATFQPVAGAIGGVQQLRQQGHYVEALTKKPDWAEWTVWRWLGRWRPPFSTVTIVPSGHKKSEFSSAYILIDDSPDNILDWVQTGRPCIVFDRPWNRDIPPHGGMWRAFSWTDLLPIVDEIGETVAV